MMQDVSKQQHSPAVEPLLVRVDVAARMLSLGRSTVYTLMESGQLPYVKYGTARRIPLAALRQWVAHNTQ
jgi:excisionase family DNA binding protein